MTTTDYVRTTGASGQMRIRDNHPTVEFWINSGDDTTAVHVSWSGTIHGSGVSGNFDYLAGSGWQKVYDHDITESETVKFKIGSTGTVAFGGPSELSVSFTRTEVPDPPGAPTFSSIGSTMLVATFEDGETDGGAEIDERQIGWGTSSHLSSMQHTQTFTGESANISGLATGVTYYFWGRTHNENGYSEWSPRSSVKTLKTPDAPTAPIFQNITPISVEVAWQNNSSGGSPFTGFQVGYSTDDEDTVPDIVLSATNPQKVVNLTPGSTYYFWVRARNTLGYGPWSVKASVTTHTGIRVVVAGVYKLAIPYVRQSSIWKQAVPYCKFAGEWKETV